MKYLRLTLFFLLSSLFLFYYDNIHHPIVTTTFALVNDNHPIILVPGYGASLLEAKHLFNESKNFYAYENWENSTKAMTYLYCKINDNNNNEVYTTFNSYSLQNILAELENYTISPTFKNSGLFDIDNLNPSTIGPKRYYFHEMIIYLKTLGYEEGKNLFAFPYDWRNSIINISKDFKDYVKKVLEITKQEQITIISHSMGGYVVKNAILVDQIMNNNNVFYKTIKNWISFATPWQGIGKSSLLSSIIGTNLNNELLNKKIVRNVVLGALSTYERLTLDLKGKIESNIYLKDLNNNIKNKIDINEFLISMNHLLKDNYVVLNNNENVNVPFRYDILQKILNSDWINNYFNLDEKILQRYQPRTFYNFIGTNKKTPTGFTITNGVTKNTNNNNNPPYLFNLEDFTYEEEYTNDGDGVVTATSVYNDGLIATKRVTFPYSHNAILKATAPLNNVKYFLEKNCHLQGKWNITLEDLNNNENETNSVIAIIREEYNWHAYSDYNDKEMILNFYGGFLGDIWNGNFKLNNQNVTFIVNLIGNLIIENECYFNEFNGYYSPLQNYSNNIQQLNNQQLNKEYKIKGIKIMESGKECDKDVSCKVENGKGIQKCYNGYLSNICLITNCNLNYQISVGQPQRPSHCILLSDTSNGWIALPIILSIIGLIIISIICGGICYCSYKQSKRTQYSERLLDSNSL
ncbi:hypothetical protein ABK040_002430 [Willaertia magna]